MTTRADAEARGRVGAWWVDKMLPGLVASLLSVAPTLAIQHVLIRRHVDRVTATQTGQLEEITAAQTAELRQDGGEG